MRILIAEDERISRATLARQLQNWGHEVVATEDGEQAWQSFQAGGFDIVITDWEMPKLSGIDLVRRIHQSAGSAFVYVILLTSRSDKSDIVSGIEAGANDFISKPFDRDELRVRVLAGERIVTLEQALSKQNAELRNANDQIHDGLRAAARIQRSMLPQRNISTPHVATAFAYVPTDELAGDAIGLHLIDDRYLIGYIIDVSGHGVPAALLSVAAMHAMAPQAEAASVVRDMSGACGLGTVRRPGQAATELNRRFAASENDGRFLTMILCVLDTHTGRLHLTSAGHPPPLLLRGTDSIPVPDAGGLPIAVMEGVDYDEAALQLQPGDRLFLFSDGVLEQTPTTGNQQFGDGQLQSLLTQQRKTPHEALVKEVIDALTRWAGARSFKDDVSIVVIDWIGP